MEDYKQFFESVEGYSLEALHYEMKAHFTIEDIYQAFKQRLIAEIQESSSVVDLS